VLGVSFLEAGEGFILVAQANVEKPNPIPGDVGRFRFPQKVGEQRVSFGGFSGYATRFGLSAMRRRRMFPQKRKELARVVFGLGLQLMRIPSWCSLTCAAGVMQAGLANSWRT
jgi:hypothetical protein